VFFVIEQMKHPHISFYIARLLAVYGLSCLHGWSSLLLIHQICLSIENVGVARRAINGIGRDFGMRHYLSFGMLEIT